MVSLWNPAEFDLPTPGLLKSHRASLTEIMLNGLFEYRELHRYALGDVSILY